MENTTEGSEEEEEDSDKEDEGRLKKMEAQRAQSKVFQFAANLCMAKRR